LGSAAILIIIEDTDSNRVQTTVTCSQFQALLQNFFSLDFLKLILLLLGVLLTFGTLLWVVERRENR